MNTFKLILTSLYKNDSVIEGRKKHWYIALLMFLLSTIVAVIPLTVSTSNTKGSDFLDNTLYSFDVGMTKFNEKLDSAGVDLVVSENADGEHIIVKTGDFSVVREAGTDYASYASDTCYRYINPTSHKTILKVFFMGDIAIATTKDFVNGQIALTNTSEAPGDISSFVVIGSHTFYTYLYNPADVASFAVNGSGFIQPPFIGNYTDVEIGTNLRNFSKFDLSGDAISNVESTSGQEKFMANWAKFYDNSYAAINSANIWISTGVMLAVDAIIGIFMMLMIFILTRGKNNPNHTFTILDSFKIGSWAMLSPALISLLVGFIFPSYASMIFVMTIGMRIMWMSMKQLRPMAPVPSGK